MEIDAQGRLTALAEGYRGQPPEPLGRLVADMVVEVLRSHAAGPGAGQRGVGGVVVRTEPAPAPAAAHAPLPASASVPVVHAGPVAPGTAAEVLRLVDDEGVPLAAAATRLGLSRALARRLYAGDDR